jgi:hypothetical protein
MRKQRIDKIGFKPTLERATEALALPKARQQISMHPPRERPVK